MPDLSKMLSVAHEIKNHFDKILMGANVHDSGEARVSATLCLTISEQFAVVLHLIEGGFSSHAPTVVRSMLEGLASLRNLVNDPSYLDQIRFDNARSDAILFKEYAANPGMQDDKDAIAILTAWKDKAQSLREELEARGFQQQGVIEKFKKANIFDSYVVYRVFCSFAHNQLTTLISRHAGKFQLRYHDEAPIEMTTSVMTVSLDILYQAIETLSKFTDLPDNELRQAINDADVNWKGVHESKLKGPCSN